jgi:hypothetical protein
VNARKQRRVKAVSCKYSLMRVLLGESCDCITGEEINFERIDCEISTDCEITTGTSLRKYYTLEKVF